MKKTQNKSAKKPAKKTFERKSKSRSKPKTRLPSQSITLSLPLTKLKPWGREIWFAQIAQIAQIAQTPTQTATQKANYAGKILEIKKGHRYSLQYHEKKYETQYIVSGKAKFTYGTDLKNLQHKILKKGDKIDIPPYTIHRLEALTDTVVFEVSTPELNDVVKLQDDYGRKGKGNNEALDKNIAQNLATNPTKKPKK